MTPRTTSSIDPGSDETRSVERAIADLRRIGSTDPAAAAAVRAVRLAERTLERYLHPPPLGRH